MRAGHYYALFGELKEIIKMADLGEEILNNKIRAMQSRLRVEVEQFIKEGVDVVNEVKADHAELEEMFTEHPELIDDTISLVILENVGEHLPWYAPAWFVKLAINKVIAVAMKKYTKETPVV